MRARAAVTAVTFAAASLLVVPSAVAKDDSRAVCNPGTQVTILNNAKYAESFVAGHNGKVDRGFVETYNVSGSGPATYTVEIWAADLLGFPTGTGALASTTVSNPGDGYALDYPVFATPAKVTKGANYAFVVHVPDATKNGVVAIAGNICPGTFSLSATEGGAFTADPTNRDLEFLANIHYRRHRHRRR